MKIRSVKARRFVRRMRGGAQSHLIECDDENSYVVKFSNNPQGGRRILVNDCIGSILATKLGLSTPEVAVVHVGHEFRRTNPDACISWGSGKIIPPNIGPHFGSRYVGGASTTYDFLPDSMLPEVVNRDQFFGVLLFDKWTSNADGRQAVFYRARFTGGNLCTPVVGWGAKFIDNGLCFQGRDWVFRDSPVQGLYCRKIVYGRKPTMFDCAPWLIAMNGIGPDITEMVFSLLPRAWIRGQRQERELKALLGTLNNRRERMFGLLAQSLAVIRAKNSKHLPLASAARADRTPGRLTPPESRVMTPGSSE